MDDTHPPETPSGYSINRIVFIGFIFIVGVVFWYLYDLGIFFTPRFDGEKTIIVGAGETAEQTGRNLQREGIIRSVGDFLLYLKITGHDTSIKPGVYVFREPISVPKIVARIAGDTREIDVTLIEGMTNNEMAIILERAGLFSKKSFLAAAEGKEGYLFPDTYRIFQNATPESFVDRLSKQFDNKISQLLGGISRQNKSVGDIVVMASLIEKEASGDTDRAIISGILWKRIEKNIPLQVDATLSYLTGKSSEELTTEDLKIDSLYNTYRNKGLPKAPIGNPGLKALEAAVYPKASPYLFYLHDKNGVVHFARTFEEHKQNKTRYLK
jgi:UPF0755 protein